MSTVNDIALPGGAVTTQFTFSPSQTYTYVQSGGGTFTAQQATGSTVTFTAAAQIDDPTNRLRIIEYRWDFGDGQSGYGQTVTHTYAYTQTASLNALRTVTLRITDDHGRHWFGASPIYL